MRSVHLEIIYFDILAACTFLLQDYIERVLDIPFLCTIYYCEFNPQSVCYTHSVVGVSMW